jgi:hypothetical protein
LITTLESPSFDFSVGFDTTFSVVDGAGKVTVFRRNEPLLSSGTNAVWSQSGKEFWITKSEGSRDGYLYAVDLAGRERRVLQVPGSITVHDASRDGRLLIEQDIWESRASVGGIGTSGERDISWLNQTLMASVADGGALALFSEVTEAGGSESSVYLRRTDGSPAKRIGSGIATALSGDGKWALAIPKRERNHLVLLPTGVGEPRPLTKRDFTYISATFLPDGKRILTAGFENIRGTRAYLESLEGGEPRAVTPEGLAGYPALSPDGSSLAAPVAGGKALIYPIKGGQPRPVQGFEAGDAIIRWAPDDSLFVYRPGSYPTPIFRIDLATGKRKLWKELKPEDPSGVIRINRVVMSPDARSYAYTYDRVLYSALYVLEGVK